MDITKLLENANRSRLTPTARIALLDMVENCQQQIRSGGGGLYRGVSVPTGEVISKEPIRTDRLSRSMSYFATVVFNEIFDEIYGISSLRNRCSFVTSSPRAASTYGALHIAFVPDQAKLVYRPNRSDTMSTLSSIKMKAGAYIRDHVSSGLMMEFNDLAMNPDYVDNPKLMDDFLKRAFSDHRSTGSVEEFYLTVKQSAKNDVSGYQVESPSVISNIPENAPYGTEVMITSAHHLYIVNYNAVAKFLDHPDPKNYKSVYNEFLDYLVMELE